MNLRKDRGQACDGAGNMSGPTGEILSLVAAEYPLAIYLGCASHCLNLVVKSLQLTHVQNMIGVFEKKRPIL